MRSTCRRYWRREMVVGARVTAEEEGNRWNGLARGHAPIMACPRLPVPILTNIFGQLPHSVRRTETAELCSAKAGAERESWTR